ncbi:RraA family protein [Bacillus sp. JJ1503]|uniref:RraA family protein n=1 Tax=Bacillus sp. JJ1503 TaxID=3122956 RepID=UPI003000F11E
MSVGNRVFLKRELPDLNLVEQFKSIQAANVADCMERLSALSSEIKLMSKPKEKVMAGVALTVKARPGDNLLLHKALNIAGEGDIIIVSNEGDRTQALLGEIMATYAAHTKKIAGLVLDGPIRDIDVISQMDLPIYATGTTPGGPFKEGPGEVNVPIACGGIHVSPGDIILGDADGVVVIPRNDAATILEAAKVLSANDQKKVQAATDGTAKRGWVDEKLKQKNCGIIDDVYN